MDVGDENENVFAKEAPAWFEPRLHELDEMVSESHLIAVGMVFIRECLIDILVRSHVVCMTCVRRKFCISPGF